ncbi:sensor histidine kinase [Rhodococcus sp. BH2-1]|nr:sensor histidine kinase [Rhodococcus sp. BH2-1]
MLCAMQLGAHLLFFLLLAVGITRVVADDPYPLPVITLSAAVAAWYLCGIWFVRRIGFENGDSRERRLGQGWLGILVLGWLTLMVADINFVWLAFALFFLCFPLLFTPAALVLTVAAIVGPTFGALVAAGMAVIYQQLMRQSAQRGQLVDELTEAHRELLRAQDELIALQREAGALSERSRLARDIHDTLAQGFSSILLLSRAEQRGPVDPVAIVTQIADTAQQNLVEARRVVDALAPAALETAPLHSALRRLLGQLEQQTGVAGELFTDGEIGPHVMDYDVALLRVAQSALANVRPHSRARRVRAASSYSVEEVRIDIVDDGVGFDQREAGGFGLRSMRERLRLEELGGTLVVESAPGDGTAIAATLPAGRVR